MVVKLFPDIRHNSQAHKVHQVGLAIIEDPLDEEEQDDDDGKEEKHPRVLLEEDIIQGRLHKEGLGRCHEGNRSHEGHGNSQLRPIGLDQFKESAIERHRFAHYSVDSAKWKMGSRK